jgi:hypothetical protein
MVCTGLAGEYTFLYGKGNKTHELVMGFLDHKKSISAVKRVEFDSDRTSHIVLGGCWCHVLNIHAPKDHKIDGVKDNFYDELKIVFDKFPIYYMNILLGHFNAKVGREEILNRQLVMKIYTKLVIIMELK